MIFIQYFDENSLSKQNGMPRSVASHRGLYCLPMSHKRDAMLIILCVNRVYLKKS